MYTQLMNKHRQEKQCSNRVPYSRSPGKSSPRKPDQGKNRIFDESKFDYDEAIYDERSSSTANFYGKNHQNKKAAQQKQGMQQSNCYQHLMHKAYNNNTQIKESPVKKKIGAPINLVKDSITEAYQMEQKMKIDLGENPFDFGRKQAYTPNNQCQSMRSEEGDAMEIKVFPNSTKQKLEKTQKHPAKNKKPPDASRGLEKKLFNDSLAKPTYESYRSNSYNHRQNLDSTVVVDTDKIKQDYMNQSFAAPKYATNKSLSTSSHSRNDVISIKLTRNPDKHFYQFIEEYGMIVSCASPSQTQFSPSTSIHIFMFKLVQRMSKVILTHHGTTII